MTASPPLSPFRRAAAAAAGTALGVDPALLVVTTPPDPSMGDYAVGCFPAAKALRAAPAALAQKVVASFQPTDLLAEATAHGPYVNFRLHRGPLFRTLLERTISKTARPISTSAGEGKTVCIDFSSPNIAKELAYHHIRSTVIGQSLVNIYRALGYRVVGINHLGDWGTTHGMLLCACDKWGFPEPLTIAGLNELYVRFREAMKKDPALEDQARQWFKRLEEGEPSVVATWQRFRDVSLAEFKEVYNLLGIHFEEIKGESEYQEAMPSVIQMLEQKGLTSISEGALVVDLSDQKMPPLLLRKADGTTLYATRDLAAAMYRHEKYQFVRSLYVVAREQGLHFQQLFATLKKAGLDWADRMEHVSFGLVRIGGRKSGTRSGNAVLLRDVLNEAKAEIHAKLKETSPDLPPDQADAIATVVGHGAVVFANLASQREKDVDFDWDEILSLEGDAGPYVQYAHARTASVLRRGGVADPTELSGIDVAPLVREEEWNLAKLLVDLGDETARAAQSNEPHVVARYLLDVCASFSRWYTLGNQDPALKVLCADERTKMARLALTAGVREILRTGLGLLGLKAPDAM
ncbi:MAG: arginine--tRNA ligase [Deltaproteobacteria bacterium]|nr:arginine--tRNA ligase [Deltaproteobacteria bacterium]